MYDRHGWSPGCIPPWPSAVPHIQSRRWENVDRPQEQTPHLHVGVLDGRRRGDQLGTDLLAIDLPGGELVDGRLVQTDQRAERPADKVQFVLDNQVGRTQRRVFQRLGRRETQLGFGMERRVFDLWRFEPVPLAETVHLPEEHLHFALPRHLGELVHGRNKQRRQAAVYLFINHNDRQALVRRLAFAEEALAELVAAVGQRATGTVGVGPGVQMLPAASMALPHHGQAVS